MQVDLEGGGGLRRLLHAAREHTVAKEGRERLGGHVVISVDDDRLFAYADGEEDAREAARVLSELAVAHDMTATTEIKRWHPEGERWEDPDVALPTTDQERDAERAERDAREAADSAKWGYAEWEVRAELPTPAEATALADRLEGEGFDVLRRSHHVLVGAATEDEAEALATRVRAEAPEGTKVTAQGSEAYQWAQLHPFSILGGLGT